ncbi:MAG: dockerin type I repeat-containing protein [Oscillospiraceae bacterium]|nr:dockerin type I repeat-containing protein [Oscillospiraceae bacterium]
MKKHIKITAFVSAICCMVSSASLTSYAGTESIPRFICSEGENGTAIVENYTNVIGFVAVTDGTELDELTMEESSNLSDPIDTVQRVAADNQNFVTLWDEQSAALFSSHDADVKYYSVTVHRVDRNSSRLSEIARNFMLAHEGVTDVILYGRDFSGTAVWNGDITIYLKDGMTDAEFEAFSADFDESIITEYEEQYAQWQQAISDWESTTDISGMTASEVAASREAAGIPSDYEMMDYAYGIAKQLGTDYPDAIAFAQPEFTVAENQGKIIFSGSSAWNGVGDVDADAVINSVDAASVLVSAASVGSGNAATLDADALKSADVNADGAVNAVDAAGILQYAAEVGAGYSGTLGEYLVQLN